MEAWRLNLQEARIRAHLSSNNGMATPYVTVKLVPGSAGSPVYSKVKTTTQQRKIENLFFICHLKFKPIFKLLKIRI